MSNQTNRRRKPTTDVIGEVLDYFWPLNLVWAGWKRQMSKRAKKTTDDLIQNLLSRLEQELKASRRKNERNREIDLEGCVETVELLVREYNRATPEGENEMDDREEQAIQRGRGHKKESSGGGFRSPPAKPRWNRDQDAVSNDDSVYVGSGDSYVGNRSTSTSTRSYGGYGYGSSSRFKGWGSWNKPLPKAEADDLPIPPQYAAILPPVTVASEAEADNSGNGSDVKTEPSASGDHSGNNGEVGPDNTSQKPA